MEKDIEVPEDLGVLIGTKEEALWQTIGERAEKAILSSQAEIEINQKILELAKEKTKNLEPSKPMAKATA